jgi:hypothetical protein
VREILSIFVGRGYCLSADVTPAPGGGGVEVRVTGPATLWGLSALASQRAPLATAHDAMAVAAYLRASGRGSSREVELSDTGYTERWTVI